MNFRALVRDRRVAAALHVLVIVGLWFAISAYQTRGHTGHDGGPAPAFKLSDLSGRSVSLTDYRHKKVVLHFFATWCGVCKAELPSLRALARGLDEDEVLLALAADSDDVEALRRFAREHELDYPILLGSSEVLRAYGVNQFPTNYYMNGDGSVSSSTVGLSTLLGMKLRLLIANSGGAHDPTACPSSSPSRASRVRIGTLRKHLPLEGNDQNATGCIRNVSADGNRLAGFR